MFSGIIAVLEEQLFVTVFDTMAKFRFTYFEGGKVILKSYHSDILQVIISLSSGAVTGEFLFMCNKYRPHRVAEIFLVLEGHRIKRMISMFIIQAKIL